MKKIYWIIGGLVIFYIWRKLKNGNLAYVQNNGGSYTWNEGEGTYGAVSVHATEGRGDIIPVVPVLGNDGAPGIAVQGRGREMEFHPGIRNTSF